MSELCFPLGQSLGAADMTSSEPVRGIITAKLFVHIGQCDVGIGSGKDGGAR